MEWLYSEVFPYLRISFYETFSSLSKVLLFYPVSCFLMAVICFILQGFIYDALFPSSNNQRRRIQTSTIRESNRRWGIIHYTFRGFVSVFFAFGLPTLSGIYPWKNLLMKHIVVSSETTKALSMYFRLHIGFIIFRMFGNDLSSRIIALELIGSIHILLLALLNPIWAAFKASPPGGLFTLFFYFDFLDACINFKIASVLDGSKLIPWKLLKYLWLIFRILIPMYGVYHNGLGWFVMWTIFGVILMFQFFLMWILPKDQDKK